MRWRNDTDLHIKKNVLLLLAIVVGLVFLILILISTKTSRVAYIVA